MTLAHLAVILAVVVGLWAPRLEGPIDLRWDAALYYVLGTSLYEGKGYRLLNEPGEIRAVQTPPLLPAVVALHQRVLGSSDFLVVGPWLRVTFFALSVALAVATYRLARIYLAPTRSLLATAVASLSFHTFAFSDILFTELPFGLAATLLVIAHYRGERSGSRLAATLAGGTVVAGYLLRTAGLALMAAWVGESLIGRRFRQAAVRGIVSIVPVVLWHGYVAVVTGSPEYRQPVYPYQRAAYYWTNVTYTQNIRLVAPFRPELGRATGGQLIARALDNLALAPVAIGQTLSVSPGCWTVTTGAIARQLGRSSLPAWSVPGALLLLGALVAAGAGAMAARGHWLVPLGLAASVGLIAVLPWPEFFPRYLTPMTPFMAVSLVVALGALTDRARGLSRRARWITLGTALTVAVGLFVLDATCLTLALGRLRVPVAYHDARGKEHVHALMFYGPEWRAVDQSLEWVRRHAQAGDIVATTVPHTAYVRTGVKAVLPPMVTDPAEARRLLDAVPVRYVVTDSLDLDISSRYAGPAVLGDPLGWGLVYTTPGRPDKAARVYERLR